MGCASFGGVWHVVHSQRRKVWRSEHLEELLVFLLCTLSLSFFTSLGNNNLLVVVVEIKDDVSKFRLVSIGDRFLHTQLSDLLLAVRVQVDASSNRLVKN